MSSGRLGEDVQTRTFKRWCLTVLSKVPDKTFEIDVLEEAFVDGTVLAQLLQVLSGKRVKHSSKPRMPIHKMENLNACLTFLAEEGVKLVNVGASDIMSCNKTIVLGLIWTIILHYQIAMFSEQSTSSGSTASRLLAFVNAKCEKMGVSLTRFSAGFEDGRVVSGLVNSLATAAGGTELIDVAQLSDPVRDTERAMLLAKANFQIPIVIDAADLVRQPEKLSVMTYLSYFVSAHEKLEEGELTVDKLVDVDGSELASVHQAAPLDLSQAAVVQPEESDAVCLQIGDGNVAAVESVAVVVTRSDGSPVAAKAIDNGDGTFEIEFDRTEPGEYLVAVTVNDTPVPEYRLSVEPQKAAVAVSACTLQAGESDGRLKLTVVDDDGVAVVEEVPVSASVTFFEAGDGGDGRPHDVAVVHNGDGTYEIDFDASAEGEYLVAVAVNGELVAGCPHRVRVGPDTSAADSVDASACALQAGESAGRLKLSVVNGDGAAVVEEVPVSASVVYFEEGSADGTKREAAVVSNGDGTYSIDFDASAEGEYLVAATVNGELVADCPRRVRVGPDTSAADSVDASACTLEAGDSDGRLKLSVVNGDGAAVVEEVPVSASVVYFEEGSADGTKRDAAVVSNGDGTYSIDFDAGAEGEYLVAAAVNGDLLPGCPRRVRVGPDTSAADSVDASACALEAGESDGRLKLSVVNGDGAAVVEEVPVSASVVYFEEGSPDGTKREAAVVSNGDGTYSIDFDASAEGEYLVAAAVNGELVAGCPHRVRVGPDTSAADSVDASACTLEAGDSDGRLKLSVVNGDGAAVVEEVPVSASVVFFEDGSTDGTKRDAAVVSNGDGTYSIDFDASAEGEYLVAAAVNGKLLPGCPRRVRVGPDTSAADSVDASACTLEAGNSDGRLKLSVVNGDGAAVVEEVPVSASVVYFEEGSADGTKRDAAVVSNGDGTYSIDFDAGAEGEYLVAAAVNGKLLPGCPRRVRVGPDMSAADSVDASACALEAGESDGRLKLSVVNGDGAAVTDDVPISASVVYFEEGSADGTKRDAAVVSNGDGTYSIDFDASAEGEYLVAAAVNGDLLPGCPRRVRVGPDTSAADSVDASACALEAGDSDGRLKLSVVNGDGAAVVEEVPVSASVVYFEDGSTDGTKRDAAVVSNGDGTYSIDFDASAEGEYLVAAAVNGELVAGCPHRVRVGPDTSAADSVDASACTLKAGESDGRLKLSVVNGDGAAVTDDVPISASVVYFEEGSADGTKRDAAVVSNGDGTYSVDFDASAEGEYLVAATVSGELVAGCPRRVRVGPDMSPADSVDASACTLEAGESGGSLKLSVVNGDGAAVVEEVPVSASVVYFEEGSTDGTKREAAVVSNGDGTYSIDFDAGAEGEYLVAATVNGELVADCPHRVRVGPDTSAADSVDASACTLEVGDSAGSLKLSVVDGEGAAVTDDVPISASVVYFEEGSTDSTERDATTTSNGDGTYSITFDASNPGEYLATCAVNGHLTSLAPVRVLVANPSAPSVADSYVSAADDDASLATLSLCDANGNRLLDSDLPPPDAVDVRGVLYTSDNNAVPFDVQVVLGDDGDYEFRVESLPDDAAEVIITASIDGKLLPGCPLRVQCKREYSEPTPVVTLVSPTESEITASVEVQGGVQVLVRDADGAPLDELPDGAVDVTVVRYDFEEEIEADRVLPSYGTKCPACIAQQPGGVFQVETNFDEPGQYIVVVTANGSQVKNSPYRVVSGEPPATTAIAALESELADQRMVVSELRAQIAASTKDQPPSEEVEALRQSTTLAESRLGALRSEFKATVKDKDTEIMELTNILNETQQELANVQGTAGDRRQVLKGAREVFAQLKPWIGIEIPKDDDETAASGSDKELGVNVIAIRGNGPAAQAGICVGDVLEQAGSEYLWSNSAVAKLFKKTKPGDRLMFVVRRAERAYSMKIEVGSKAGTYAFKREDLLALRRMCRGVVRPGDLTLVKFFQKKLGQVQGRRGKSGNDAAAPSITVTAAPASERTKPRRNRQRGNRSRQPSKSPNPRGPSKSPRPGPKLRPASTNSSPSGSPRPKSAKKSSSGSKRGLLPRPKTASGRSASKSPRPGSNSRIPKPGGRMRSDSKLKLLFDN